MRRKVKVEWQHSPFKGTFVPSFARTIPFPIHNLKGQIFVRRSGPEANDAIIATHFVVIVGATAIIIIILQYHRFQGKLRGDHGIDQIGIKDIELVPLYNFGWWIVTIVMCLIVFRPVVPTLYPIVISWFPRSILLVVVVVVTLVWLSGWYINRHFLCQSEFFFQILLGIVRWIIIAVVVSTTTPDSRTPSTSEVASANCVQSCNSTKVYSPATPSSPMKTWDLCAGPFLVRGNLHRNPTNSSIKWPNFHGLLLLT